MYYYDQYCSKITSHKHRRAVLMQERDGDSGGEAPRATATARSRPAAHVMSPLRELAHRDELAVAVQGHSA